MQQRMTALIYEAPYEMAVRTVDIPVPGENDVLIEVAFSGICGSELSGFEGKNSLRQPPLIFGHEFSGTIARMGAAAQAARPELFPNARVTVNPLVTCGKCEYCLHGRQPLCPQRKLLSAHLPGSNAAYVCAPASAVYCLPDGMSMTTAALTEPAACAVHAVRLAAPRFGDTALVIGAGPIGLLMIEALQACGVQPIYCAELNPNRRSMAEQLGAIPVSSGDVPQVNIAIDAVGVTATRQACVAAVRLGGRVVFEGLHEADSLLPINDIIRREIALIGSFCYTPADFAAALDALAQRRLWLDESWTRIEPLENGKACFEELLHGSPVAKIWLQPAH